MQFRDGRVAIVGAQRVQERSSRSRVRITLQELFSIWLGGRITSPREWFGAGGQGVTLELAWGPSNSSPRNLHFVFAVFSLLFFPLSQFLSYFYSNLFFFLRNYLIGALCFFVFTYIRFWYFSVPFFSFSFLSFTSLNTFYFYPFLSSLLCPFFLYFWFLRSYLAREHSNSSQ